MGLPGIRHRVPAQQMDTPTTVVPHMMSAPRLIRLVVRNPNLIVGGVVVLTIVAAGLLAPVLPIPDPSTHDLPSRLKGSSRLHPMGTDGFGRDVLSNIVWGSRLSLGIAGAAVLVGGTIGVGFGMIGGLLAGNIDRMIMAVVDVMMAFPSLLLAILLVALMGSGAKSLIAAIALVNTSLFIRMARAEMLRIREESYVEAARAVGADVGRILRRHILPNAIAPLIVLATIRFASAILTESTLSFLGLGIPPEVPSWGGLIAEGKDMLQRAPWVALWPGVIIMLSVLGLNLFGDGLRDALDPRIRSVKGKAWSQNA